MASNETPTGKGDELLFALCSVSSPEEASLLRSAIGGDDEARRTLLWISANAVASGRPLSPALGHWLAERLRELLRAQTESKGSKEAVLSAASSLGFRSARGRSGVVTNAELHQKLRVISAVRILHDAKIPKTECVTFVAAALGVSESKLWAMYAEFNDVRGALPLDEETRLSLRRELQHSPLDYSKQIANFFAVT
jgi:hypothetical protein